MSEHYEGRPPKAAVEVLDKAPRDLLSIVEENANSSKMARRLRSKLKMFDLAKASSAADIAGAYQMVAEFVLAFGHIKDYRQQFDTLLKAIDGYAKHRKEYLLVDFPAELTDQIRSHLTDLKTSLEPMVMEDHKEQFGRVFDIILESIEIVDEE